MTATRPTLQMLAADLAAGRATSRDLVEAALARIADPAGEGKRAFVKVYAETARAAAAAQDKLRAAGYVASPLAGIPVSIKDLFDVAGERTLAGSKALDDAPPAAADAPIVARLKAAGAVLVGRTNMTEFAFSGVGINPHYGTPGNPWDRAHIPGGSSSGAPISVADGMAAVAIGTDTGGSVRIPASLCGLVGLKPTQYPRSSRRGDAALDHAGFNRSDRRQRRLLRSDRRDHGRRCTGGAAAAAGGDAAARHSPDRGAGRSRGARWRRPSSARSRRLPAPAPASSSCRSRRSATMPASTPRAASRPARPMPGTRIFSRAVAATTTRGSESASSAAGR